jgi:hypothetical protein
VIPAGTAAPIGALPLQADAALTGVLVFAAAALGNPGDPRLARQVRREAIIAAILRALIAALSLALLALGAVLAG